MYPDGTRPELAKHPLAIALHDGWILEDGQILHWDIKFIQYRPQSDHYDRDHYEYYVQYMPNFLVGADRQSGKFATEHEITQIEKRSGATKDICFNAMCEAFSNLDFMRVLRAVNPGIESVAVRASLCVV